MRGAVVLLLGDDTVPSRNDFLAAHVLLHVDNPALEYAVLGRVVWSTERPVTPFMRWLDEGGMRELSAGEPGPVSMGRIFYGSHVSLKRELLLESGGFDDASRTLPSRTSSSASASNASAFNSSTDRTRRTSRPPHDPRRVPPASRPRRAGRGAVQPDPPRAAPLGPEGGSGSPVDGGERAVPLLRPLADAPLPTRTRNWIWRLLHLAAYAEGYDAGPPPPRSGRPRAQVAHQQSAQ